MFPIKDLLFAIDPSLQTWEEYEQSQMDMIPSSKLAVLQSQKAKWRETKQRWFADYNEDLLEKI